MTEKCSVSKSIMCGLTGFLDYKKESSEELLFRMTDILEHRGPDDRGTKLWKKDDYILGFGHRRLSIIDLSQSGHQPMTFDNLTIVYNGEIYNFKEIKQDLEQAGYSFSSNCDTEVILKAFHKWGPHCVQRFIGMFAFVLYDIKDETIYLFRDRAGVKPLYYYQDDNLFLFSSELKSFYLHPQFKKEIDMDSLGLFLQYGYIPAPYTIFKKTWKVFPGYYYVYSIKSRSLEELKYWDVVDVYNEPKIDISEKDALAELERILISACNYRMIADVPVGVFLSGGYDSSAVTALLQTHSTSRIKTFTIGFHEKEFNEAPFAASVARYLGTEHTEYYCTQQEALEIIPKIPYYFDEPFGDSSAIPTMLVSQVARKNVTVILSADAGDETFAGYGKYQESLKLFGMFKHIPQFLKSWIHGFMNVINPVFIPFFNRSYNYSTRYKKIREILLAKNSIQAMKIVSQYFVRNEVEEFLAFKTDFGISTFFDSGNSINSSNDDLNKLLAIDYKTYMVDDILTKVDRATMSVSLEGREPLLDHRIIEFVAKLPSSYKINNGVSKYLFRKLVHSHIPKEIMERPKMGFGVPVVSWFRDKLKPYLMEYLDGERLKKVGIFNERKITGLRDFYLDGKRENEQKLWFLLMFEMWYDNWMK